MRAFGWCQVAIGHRAQHRTSGLCSIAGGFHRGQVERHRGVAPGRGDAFKAQAQRRCIAAQRHCHGLAGQGFGFTVQKRQRRLCRLVTRALGLARVAGAKGAIRIAFANEPLTRRPILQNSKSLWM